ncbi:MAG: Unknown protein, partial [uncultured Thiotrichaceae bacterium]
SPYEAPNHPDIRLDTTHQTPAEAARKVIDWLFGEPS